MSDVTMESGAALSGAAGGAEALLGSLVAALDAADVGDLPGLAALHTRLQQATSGLPESSALRARLLDAAGTIEAVVLGDVADPVQTLAELAHDLADSCDETPESGTADMTAVLDQIAEALLLVEADDLPALASLHTQFERIADWAEAEAEFEVAKVASEAGSLLEAIVLAEVADEAAALRSIMASVEALQSVVRDGRQARDVAMMRPSTPVAEVEPLAEVDADQPVAAAAAQPQKIEGDESLLGDFVAEAREHLEACDVNLLTLETDPTHDEALNAVFRAFHTIKGVAGFLALRDVTRLSHEAENVLERARSGSLLLEGMVVDVIFEAVDLLKALVQAVHDALHGDGMLAVFPELDEVVPRLKLIGGAPAGAKLGDLLVQAGLVTKGAVDSALQRQSTGNLKLGEQLVKDGDAKPKDVAIALRAQKSAAGGRQAQSPSMATDTVRVDPDRLDRLIDTIGELVIAESMVSQADDIRGLGSASVQRQISQLDKITRELQELGTSLRMVPVRATFQKMARLVRDLGVKTGKQVEFATTGEDTELDRSVVERIGDPLVHMVRNAVDHGIETEVDDRLAAGKPAVARVELRAFHKGGNIHIEIHDDGRGLDKDAIVAKAIERGIIKEGEPLSDREAYALIFEPGFSTAKQVTDVSGRGVGMDVVKRNIEALRGAVDIRSEKGKGSVFTIRLPLTLAVIDGMVVRVGDERYVLPTLSIVTSIRPSAQTLSSVLDRGEMLDVQGQLVPLFRLSSLFGIPGAIEDATEALAIVVDDDGRRVCLLADELLGQQQIVIKSLGETMRGLLGISGGAIMPDGLVGLILDVSGLVKLAEGNGLALDLV
ncbi:MAG: chemotaxis protein CheA [Armatimonadetes bacterium]|nr:chemotaxis protein CheA [Armatimonadota bacterium]